MSARSGKRPKHIPQRTCVGCRQVLPKRSLIRLVRTSEGIEVDLTGKLPGRGAYLHDQQTCWMKGLKGPIEKALRITLREQDKAGLLAYMEKLPSQETEGDLPDKDAKMA